MGGCNFFYFFTVQFNRHISQLAMQDFHPRSHPSLVPASLRQMLTALFNLILSTQKSKWTIFFEGQGKVFLNIEKIFEKISQAQP